MVSVFPRKTRQIQISAPDVPNLLVKQKRCHVFKHAGKAPRKVIHVQVSDMDNISVVLSPAEPMPITTYRVTDEQSKTS